MRRPFAAAALGGLIGCVGVAEPTRRCSPRSGSLRYDERGRRLILPLKHADRTELAMTIAPHMARAGAELLQKADVLVPVPLHRSRLFHRRYNQAALLAQAMGRIAGRPWLLDALVRRRATASWAKSATERAVEVAEAFAVKPSRMRASRARVCCWWMTS